MFYALALRRRGNFSSNPSGITFTALNTLSSCVFSSFPPSLVPSQKFSDVQQRADGRCSLHGGSAGEDSAAAGTQSKKFHQAARRKLPKKKAKTKQSRRWPGDALPSAAAATTGLRTPLCAALASTPRASSRRSSIINANEAEGAEGRGGEGREVGAREGRRRPLQSVARQRGSLLLRFSSGASSHTHPHSNDARARLSYPKEKIKSQLVSILKLSFCISFC